MNKVACALFFIAVSLEAQTGRAAQGTAPAKPEVASQSQPQPPSAGTWRWEQPFAEQARKNLRKLGYFNAEQPKVFGVTPMRCAIPLVTLPVPNKERFASRNVPANPAIDPKITLAPPSPACLSGNTPKAIATPEPSAAGK